MTFEINRLVKRSRDFRQLCARTDALLCKSFKFVELSFQSSFHEAKAKMAAVRMLMVEKLSDWLVVLVECWLLESEC